MVFGAAAASRSILVASSSSISIAMNAVKGGIDGAGGDGCGVKVLDMSAYYSGDPHKLKDFVAQLRVQCQTTGFFYLQNHSVPQHLCDAMLQLARKFFTSPLDAKMSIDYTKSAQFRGYMRLGWENTLGLPDYREQLDFGPEEEEETDMINGSLNHLVYPLYQRLRGPNQWLSNETIPHFRPIVEDFMFKMSTLSMEVMKCIALSLGLSKDYFDSSFGHKPHYQMKVARYPPVPEPEIGGNVSFYGVGPHTDSGYLSFLLQDDVGGLQALSKDGNWIDVLPRRGTFVVNLGEMLQLATNGLYLATMHRVVSCQGQNSRYSVPFFFNPRLDAKVEQIPITEFSSAVSKDAHSNALLSNFLVRGNESCGGRNKIFPIFGDNAFKSFARSHPQLVKMHHPDLLEADGSIVFRETAGDNGYVLYFPS